MKFTQQYMNETLGSMLGNGETSLCPVYCSFLDTGFFANARNINVGFVTCTSSGRLLMARASAVGMLKDNFTRGGCFLTALKNVRIKKNIFGQHVVEFAIPDTKRDIKIKLQISSKVLGCDLPYQEQNTAVLLDTLSRCRQA